ncbi:MAG: Uma2 family endonuclease [Gemmatimonadaceae bacterium]|nr:Uma2 family endonuclease [Gemmatimonadaceae bacterium]
MPAAAHRWTLEERDALPDDRFRRELLDGELLVSPGCSGAHQEILRRLLRLVGDFVEHHGIGTATFAPFDVVYSAHDVLEPDLVVLPAPASTLGTHWDGAAMPPTLIVEIVSPSSRTRDYRRKRDFFVAGNALEYWIVDPEQRVIVVVRPGASDVTHAGELEWRPAGEAVLRVDITALFAGLSREK